MSVAQRLDAADGVIDGKYFGRPIVERRTVAPAYRSSTAAALDAADGVIDGRYYGRPIVEAPASRYYGTPVTRYGGYYSRYGNAGYTSSTAAALDAADGVIDGKYYGRPIIETSSGYPVRRAGYYPAGAAPVTRYAGRYYDDAYVNYGARRYVGAATAQPYYDDLALGRRVYNSGLVGELVGDRPIDGYYAPRPYRSSTALTLDAADGVIDGRYYGRPIVEAPVRRYVGGSLAERLDAADGVIDGRYYGRPIVEAPARRYVGGSLAEKIDAADGVIDGKYYGRPIVQV